MGSASWRSQAKPFLVHKLGCFGGTTPALRNSARTEFLALVRLAITCLRQLINSRQFRTSSDGTCTVGNVGASCTANADCNQAINLDSTALSVGRGRRDIENLTQAPNIDIPVIAFGASNGLVPVPGGYTAFAQSIGTCTAPSCDGTPRVVDAANPNPAFPTLGGVNGGFEVYISEGYSHVDIVTAEDDATNNVIAPLAAFLERNTQ